MAIRSKYQIYAIKGATSNIYFWQITNLLDGNVNLFPIAQTNFSMVVNPSSSGSLTTTSDYDFIWRKNELHFLQLNITDVKYIGNGSGTPNYNTPATDLASILALI